MNKAQIEMKKGGIREMLDVAAMFMDAIYTDDSYHAILVENTQELPILDIFPFEDLYRNVLVRFTLVPKITKGEPGTYIEIWDWENSKITIEFWGGDFRFNLIKKKTLMAKTWKKKGFDDVVLIMDAVLTEKCEHWISHNKEMERQDRARSDRERIVEILGHRNRPPQWRESDKPILSLGYNDETISFQAAKVDIRKLNPDLLRSIQEESMVALEKANKEILGILSKYGYEF